MQWIYTYILEVMMHSVSYVSVISLLTRSSKGHQRSFEEETESKRKSKGIRNGGELDTCCQKCLILSILQ